MKNKNIKVSEFDNFHSPKNEISILESFAKIKNGFYKKLIKPIREAKNKGETELFSNLKTPFFLFLHMPRVFDRVVSFPILFAA